MSIFNGTSGDDLNIVGTGVPDIFYGSTGNDAIDGGNDVDRISYDGSIESYVINYRLGNIVIDKPDGSQDTLTNVEQISFGDYIYSLKEVQILAAGGDAYPDDIQLMGNGQMLFLQRQFTTPSYQWIETLVSFNADLNTATQFPQYDSSGRFSYGKIIPLSSNSAITIGLINSGYSVPTIDVSLYDSLAGAYSLGVVELTGASHPANYIGDLMPIKLDGNDLYFAAQGWDGNHGAVDVFRMTFDVNQPSSQPQIDFLYSIDTSAPRSIVNLMPGDQLSIVSSCLGPITPYPGGAIWDNIIQIEVRALSTGAVIVPPSDIGGLDDVTDFSLTSTTLSNGNTFASWIGLGYVDDPNGGITISDGSGVHVYSQHGYLRGALVAPDGSLVQSTFLINQNPTENATMSDACALTGGGFAIVWVSNADGSGGGVFGRVFSEYGVPVGDQFQINANNWGNQTYPKIAADDDGGFICYWSDEHNGGVFQKFDSLGRPKLMNITGTDSADVIFANDGDQQIMGGMGDDQIHAGAGDDILLGGIGNDTLFGGTGNNVIDGGTGDNTVSYADITGASVGLIVNLAAGTAIKSGSSETDQLINIENVTGTSGDDQITGSSADNILYSGSGDDVVDAGAGNDLIIGGDGAGDDIYNGGIGSDEIKYTSAVAGIIVNLGAGIATSIGANNASGIGNDTLSNIENLIAGNYGDQITGSNDNNLIYGMGGDDSINGGLGVDTAAYTISRYAAKITRSGSEYVVTSADGIDHLTDIENLQFSDGEITLASLFAGIDPGNSKPIALYRGGYGGIVQGDAASEYVKAEYSISSGDLLSIGKSADGKTLIIKTAGGSDVLKSIDSISFLDTAFTLNDFLANVQAIPLFQSSGGTGGYALPELYTGPASLGLRYQLIETADNAVVTGSSDNDFIKVASANSIGKAVNGGGGNDVIDGGVGSTFVTGGANHNTTFFLDGRAPGISWSTITDFRTGVDKATIWGFVKGVSSVDTSFTNYNNEGAGGYQGLTLHFKNLLPDGQTSGSNPNLNSITLTGHTLQEFGASSLADLNNQINNGTNAHFIVGATNDSLGTHSYLQVV